MAAKWGAAWVAHQGVAKEQWLAALEPYTTEEFLRAKMSTVDTENIAATGVTGPPVVKSSFTGSVTVDLPTNATTLSVTLIKTLNGWRVASYDEEA